MSDNVIIGLCTGETTPTVSNEVTGCLDIHCSVLNMDVYRNKCTDSTCPGEMVYYTRTNSWVCDGAQCLSNQAIFNGITYDCAFPALIAFIILAVVFSLLLLIGGFLLRRDLIKNRALGNNLLQGQHGMPGQNFKA